MASVVLSSKGQVVLPKEVRDKLGLGPGDNLLVRLEDEHIVLERAPRGRGKGWRRWRGALKSTRALDELVEEHRSEVERERLS